MILMCGVVYLKSGDRKDGYIVVILLGTNWVAGVYSKTSVFLDHTKSSGTQKCSKL